MRKRRYKKNKNGNKEKFKNYFFAFIDILGQKEFLERLEIPGKDDFMGESRLFHYGNLTVNTVKLFRKTFGDLFDSLQKNDSAILEKKQKDLTKGKPREEIEKISRQIEEFKRMKRSELKIRSFSDSIILYCPLTEDNGRFPMMDIFSILSGIACTKILLMSHKDLLRKGIFMRGGIDVGAGIILENESFYGRPLNRASRLEKEAGHPRILLSKETREYFDVMEGYSSEKQDYLRLIFTKLVKEIILADPTDGQIILDYLNPLIIENLVLINKPEILPNAYANICGAIETFQEPECKKLLERYKTLKNYFDIKIPNAPKK